MSSAARTRGSNWLLSLVNMQGKGVCLLAASMVPFFLYHLLVQTTSITEPYFLSIMVTGLFGGLTIVSTTGQKINNSRRLNVLTPLVSWLLLPLFAALPFYFSLEHVSFFDSYFEAFSALTTTGSSVLDQWHPLPNDLIIWRALLGWLGGLLCLAFIIAVFAQLNIGGMHLYHSTLARGSGEELTGRLLNVSNQILPVYSSLTIGCFILLLFSGVSSFDAFVLSLSAVSTTGFHTGHWQEPALNAGLPEFILSLFMLVGAMNILFFWWISNRHSARVSQRKREIYVLLTLVAVFTAFTFLTLIWDNTGEFSIIRLLNSAFFIVSSTISTTGFTPYIYDQPILAIGIAVSVLVLIGGTLGSTTGGFKVMRMIVLMRHAGLELRNLAHPHNAEQLRYEGTELTQDEIQSIWLWLSTGFIGIAMGAIILSLMDHNLSTSISAAIASFTTAGPMIQYIDPEFVGYYNFGTIEKVVMILLMLLGRVEGALILAIFNKTFWRR